MKVEYTVIGAQSAEEISKVLSAVPTPIDVVNGRGQQGIIVAMVLHTGTTETPAYRVAMLGGLEYWVDGHGKRDTRPDAKPDATYNLVFAEVRAAETDASEMTVRVSVERVDPSAQVPVTVAAQDPARVAELLAHYGCLAVVTTTSMGICIVTDVCNGHIDGSDFVHYQIKSLSCTRRAIVDFNGVALDGSTKITGVYPKGTLFELTPVSPQSLPE